MSNIMRIQSSKLLKKIKNIIAKLNLNNIFLVITKINTLLILKYSNSISIKMLTMKIIILPKYLFNAIRYFDLIS